MEHPRLVADLTVAEVIDRWPQAIPLLFRYRMACVGCPMARFETLAEVVAIYGLNPSRFLGELEQLAEQARERY
jgi:hybrid cluster-associated redox disulfide protein